MFWRKAFNRSDTRPAPQTYGRQIHPCLAHMEAKKTRKISCLIKAINKFNARDNDGGGGGIHSRQKHLARNCADDHFSVVRKSQTAEYLPICDETERATGMRRKHKTMHHIHTEAIKWSAKRWVGIKNKRRKILLMLFAWFSWCARALASIM